MSGELERIIILQENLIAENVSQFRVNFPKDFIALMDLKKGDKLKATLTISSGLVSLEKV